ncbi:hypothetical protein DCAR_0935362 [Daucus carota subsp. sativus]|uniref:Uncharacterized protein n=1 Tax=Daucus carota subsp. sativus TaxID=79200 RepID=A0A175YGX1_DAUCS|nr:PREDICTED: pectinesterase inhibitor 1-like [Daucus carota subsp. sativus]WOH15816.1 hypothetical protein DCAR_0935362 [Daucus carota subsp. sativus]
MAFSYSFPWLPLLLLVAVSLTTTASADQALIDSICSTTSNQTLCHQILSPSVSADRAGLGKIAVDAALQKIHKSQNLIRKIDHEKAYNKTKYQFDSCLEEYDDALSYLKEAKLYFGEHVFEEASSQASAALTMMTTCLDDAPSAPPELTAAINEYKAYLCIVLAVAYVPRNV